MRIPVFLVLCWAIGLAIGLGIADVVMYYRQERLMTCLQDAACSAAYVQRITKDGER